MSDQTTNRPPFRGAWQSQFEDKVRSVVLPELEGEVSLARKAEILGTLVKELKGHVEYDKFDPKQLSEFTANCTYKCAAKPIGHDYDVRCLQALPDGRIVSGSDDKSFRIWDGTLDESSANVSRTQTGIRGQK